MAGIACRSLMATSKRKVVAERFAIRAIVKRVDMVSGDDALGWAGALLRIELLLPSTAEWRAVTGECC